jgi:hypothetical protein
MTGSAWGYGVATDGCGFDFVADDGVEYFRMRHGYPR